jgi:hypothetical protein
MYSSFDPNNNEFVNKLDERERERINSIEKKEDRNNYDFFFYVYQ